MIKQITYFLLCFLFFASCHLDAQTVMYLKENLERAKPGDFIVTYQNNTYTLLHIYDKRDETIAIEEITAPESRISLDNFSWREWVRKEAPCHTSWVIYFINVPTGQMNRYYSYTRRGWYEIAPNENFLSNLLNLRLELIPKNERKKVGPRPLSGAPDFRKAWQPPMILDGKQIPNVSFNAWRTTWPNDGSELAGRNIEVYTPEENSRYPSYFPYWLQISGWVGKAKVRIIDSGTDLISPKPLPPQ